VVRVFKEKKSEKITMEDLNKSLGAIATVLEDLQRRASDRSPAPPVAQLPSQTPATV
jgi:hypothetical protein